HTAGVKKYSSATVGTTLALALVRSPAGGPTRSVSIEPNSPSASTAVPSSLTWSFPSASPAIAGAAQRAEARPASSRIDLRISLSPHVAAAAPAARVPRWRSACASAGLRTLMRSKAAAEGIRRVFRPTVAAGPGQGGHRTQSAQYLE